MQMLTAQTTMNQQNNSEDVFDKIIKSSVLRKAAAQKSHTYFFLMYFAHYVKYKTAEFQKDFFRLTEDKDNKLAVVAAFRGSAKSTILNTSYALWAVLGEQQKKSIFILSQTEEKAQQCLMNIKKEMEENELLRTDLGPFQEERGQWGISSLYIKNFNARIKIGSVGQSIRSMRHQQYRPDLILIDDCEDLASVKTKESREKTYQWFKSEVLPAGDKNTRTVVIGNLLHRDCLVMRLKREIEAGELSGVFRWVPIMDKSGNITWRGKYPNTNAIEEERKKIGNERVWRREFMLEIIADAEQIFLLEWIEKHQYEKIPNFDSPDYRGTYIGIDPAVSEKEDADKTGMVAASVFGFGEDMKIYILPFLVNSRFRFLQMKQQIAILHKNLAPTNTVVSVVENVAAQKWLYEDLKVMRLRVELFDVHGIEKSERLKIAAIPVEAGKVYFPNRGMEELKTQLIGFGVERFDDLADAFGIAINKIMEKTNTTGASFFKADADRVYDFQKGALSDPKKDSPPIPEEPIKKNPSITTTPLPSTMPWKNEDELREKERQLDLDIHKKDIDASRGVWGSRGVYWFS